MSTPSYSVWAARIVRVAEKPNARLASCCKVDVMNGGAGFPPELFYFGLLTGATLGGNLTPIGASANIAAIGILRKQGEQVRTRDFLRIGIPFTLAAVLTGYVYLWLVWGA